MNHLYLHRLPAQAEEHGAFSMNRHDDLKLDLQADLHADSRIDLDDENRRLKVGISCYPSVGGSGVIASTLGKQLAERGHEVHFIAYEKPFRLAEDLPRVFFHQVTINDYGLFRYPDYTLPLSVKMAEVSRNHHLDILHVHYAVPHATAAILARCMLLPQHQPRVVTTLHGTDTTLLGRDPGYGPAIHHALTQSDAVTTVSSFLKTESEHVLGFKGPMDVIYNFFEPGKPAHSREETRRALGVEPDEVMILHSSNLRPVKRIDHLLECLARVQPRDKFKLVILAGGSFAAFEEDGRQLGILDRIVVRENVLEIEEYLQAADMTLYTSESESFCLSILEAMFFGCPGVATSVGGIPEVVADGETGLLVPFGDIGALAQAVQKLVLDSELRLRLGAAARVQAQQKFSAEAIIPQYERLYRRLTHQNAMPCKGPSISASI